MTAFDVISQKAEQTPSELCKVPIVTCGEALIRALMTVATITAIVFDGTQTQRNK